LHERAGQVLLFPRRGALAGAQADDHVADAHRLAGLQRHVARLAVALVEQTEHGAPLRHRRRAIRRIGTRRQIDHRHVGDARLLVERGRFVLRGLLLRRLPALPPAIAGPATQPDQGRDRRPDGELPPRHPSGTQAS